MFSASPHITLGIIDAIRKTNGKVQYIQVRHEEAAAFMASAYGKLTGHISACLNLRSRRNKPRHRTLRCPAGSLACFSAYRYGARKLIGRGAIQEIDQQAFFEPLSVYNKTLMTEDQTTALATLAIKHALLDQGVAHIGIPNDVQKLPMKRRFCRFEAECPTWLMAKRSG